MAEDKKNGNGRTSAGGSVCACPGCCCGMGTGMGMGGGHWGGGHRWAFFFLRTLFTILILMIVFWFGVAAGRLGNGLENGYYMMQGGYYPTGVYGGVSGISGGSGLPGAASAVSGTARIP